MARPSLRHEAGFTLVELLVVVLIIAILIAIAIPTFLGFKRRADDIAAKDSAVLTVKTARGLTADDGTYTGLTGAALATSQSGLTFVAGNVGSAGPTEVSQLVVGSNVLFVSVFSRSGSCFFVQDDLDAGTTFGMISLAVPADCSADNNPAVVFGSSW
jgi:type IV pilus assembly protein PilA